MIAEAPARVAAQAGLPRLDDRLRTIHDVQLAEDIRDVGEAATGEDAVAQALELQPDVVVMDLHMPGMNGIEATRRIIETSPHAGVLVLTMIEDDDALFAARLHS